MDASSLPATDPDLRPALAADLDAAFPAFVEAEGGRIYGIALRLTGRPAEPRPGPVAGQVEHDAGQPGPDRQIADPLAVPGSERPVGADQGVLGEVLGVVCVPLCDPPDPISPPLLTKYGSADAYGRWEPAILPGGAAGHRTRA